MINEKIMTIQKQLVYSLLMGFCFSVGAYAFNQSLLDKAKTMVILQGETPQIPPSLQSFKAESTKCMSDDTPKLLVAKLSDNQKLWGLCKSIQGSNVNYNFFIINNNQSEPVMFPSARSSQGYEELISNPDISNEGRVLSSLTLNSTHEKYCGFLEEWIWNGNQFQLLNAQQLTDCTKLFETQSWPNVN